MSGSPSSWLRRVKKLPGVAGKFIRWGAPRRSLLFGPLSLGDDLLCTTVLHEARIRGTPFAMFTARPALFEGNPDPLRLLPIDDYYVAALRKTGAQVVQPYYAGHDPKNPDRDVLPPHHILAEMCRLGGLHGKVSLRPYFFLSPTERARGALHPKQVVLHSSAGAAALPFANKEWGAENFAAVARQLSPEFHLVQVGSKSDPALPVDVDLRGKTSLRETAAILSESLVFVGLEGFLAHFARAVDCPAVIIFGGRALPRTVGYPANINFYAPVDCAPCGLRSTCSFGLKCMREIRPDSVAAAVREQATRSHADLPVDVAELP